MIAIGKGQKRHELTVGDEVSGVGVPVDDPRMEIANLYKVSRLKVVQTPLPDIDAPPFIAYLPPLETYRERGHRRLAPKTYETKCSACIWGCKMPVEITVDKWKPDKKRYRTETFCYGPKSCRSYKAGPPRKVRGRREWCVETDEIDAIWSRHRGWDE